MDIVLGIIVIIIASFLFDKLNHVVVTMQWAKKEIDENLEKVGKQIEEINSELQNININTRDLVKETDFDKEQRLSDKFSKNK